MFRAIIILVTLTTLVATPVLAVALESPITCGTLSCLLIGIIRVFLGLLALFATFVFIYGGFLMIMSAGNAETVRKAKETLFWATIGIVVVLGSWVFIKYVLQTLTTVTS